MTTTTIVQIELSAEQAQHFLQIAEVRGQTREAVMQAVLADYLAYRINGMTTTTIEVTLDSGQAQRLQRLADDLGETRHDLIAHLINYYLQDETEIREIAMAVREVDEGRAVLIPHDEVMAEMQELVSGAKPDADSVA